MFKGVITAIVTPFASGGLDEGAFRHLLTVQKQAGIHGIVVGGTTGESPTLTVAELKKLTAITLEEIGKDLAVIVGTGSNNTHHSVELTQWAKSSGAAGALVVTPYYNRPTQKGLVAHFKEIAKVGFPLCAYNVPSRTGVNLLPETVAELARIPNVVAVKEATGSMPHLTKILELADKKLALLSGDDFTYLSFLALGGDGVISVVSNVVPKEMVEIYHAAAKDLPKAQQIFLKIYSLIEVLFLESNPIPVKAALFEMGLIQDELRLPLTPMSDGPRRTLKKVMGQLGLLRE